MSVPDTIRAWKDVDYRLSLTGQERSLIPPHPAGEIESEVAPIDILTGGFLEYQTTHYTEGKNCVEHI